MTTFGGRTKTRVRTALTLVNAHAHDSDDHGTLQRANYASDVRSVTLDAPHRALLATPAASCPLETAAAYGQAWWRFQDLSL